jgi:hypothetical protein
MMNVAILPPTWTGGDMELLPYFVLACMFAQFPVGLLIGIGIGIRIASRDKNKGKSTAPEIKARGLFPRQPAEPEPAD